MSKAKPPYRLRAEDTRLFLAIQDAFLERKINFSFQEVLDKWPGQRGRMVLSGETEVSPAGIYVRVAFFGQSYDVRLENDQIDQRLGGMIEEIVHPNLIVSDEREFTWHWRVPDNPRDSRVMLEWVDKMLKRMDDYARALASAKELFAKLQEQEAKAKLARQDVIDAIKSVLVNARDSERQ